MAPLSQERLDALESAVQSIGGRSLDTACRPKVLPAVPAGTFVDGSKTAAGVNVIEAYTCGCGNQAVVEVPDVTGRERRHGEPSGDLVVCAVCDAATQIPRLARLMA